MLRASYTLGRKPEGGFWTTRGPHHEIIDHQAKTFIYSFLEQLGSRTDITVSE